MLAIQRIASTQPWGSRRQNPLWLAAGGNPDYVEPNGPAARCFKNPDPRGNTMAWTTPTLTEICVGLEINGYLPAEF